jgi:hypothetical protein
LRAAATKLIPVLIEKLSASDNLDLSRLLHEDTVRRALGTVEDMTYAHAFEAAFLPAIVEEVRRRRSMQAAPLSEAVSSLQALSREAGGVDFGAYSAAVCSMIGTDVDCEAVREFLRRGSAVGAATPQATIYVQGKRLFLVPEDEVRARAERESPEVQRHVRRFLSMLEAVSRRVVAQYSEADPHGRTRQRADASFVALALTLATALGAWAMHVAKAWPGLSSASVDSMVGFAAVLVLILVVHALLFGLTIVGLRRSEHELTEYSRHQLRVESALKSVVADDKAKQPVLDAIHALDAFVANPTMPRFPYVQVAGSVAWLAVGITIIGYATLAFGPLDGIDTVRQLSAAARRLRHVGDALATRESLQIARDAATILAPKARAAKLATAASSLALALLYGWKMATV